MSGAAKVTRDHNEIKRWVEERGGRPAAVKATRGDDGDSMLLRIDFPGYSGKQSLERISWDEFFEVFDRRNLAFLHQDETAEGQQSRFCKIVYEETAEQRAGAGA